MEGSRGLPWPEAGNAHPLGQAAYRLIHVRLKTLWLERYEAVSTAAAAAYQDCIFGRFEASRMAWAEPDFNLYSPDSLTIRSLAREIGA